MEPSLEKRRESVERGPSCLGLAYFTTISSFCAVEMGERKKREIAFSGFFFFPSFSLDLLDSNLP